MTATYNESVSAPTQGATGRIARVIGPVVDVEFPAGQVNNRVDKNYDMHTTDNDLVDSP